MHRLLLCALTLVATPALAQQTPFKPEQLSVKASIDPGPNIFVNQMELKGAGSFAVYSRDDLKFKGLMAAGSMAQMLVSADGKTAFAQSTFMKRITYGPVEHVLTIFDVAGLKIVGEVSLPPKAAMALAYQPLLQQSADGKLVYVQNATPASSISIVDAKAKKFRSELPTPGCWGIYPSIKDSKLSTICADGSFETHVISSEGKAVGKAKSAKVFAPDVDPIFINGVRIGETLGFVSYKGQLLLLSDADKAMKAVDTIQLNQGVDGGWAPGGYAIAGYATKAGVLFVGMHPNSSDGSHKNPASEIWAYDVKAKKLLARSSVEGILSFSVAEGDVPLLFGVNTEFKIVRFTADPKAGFALSKTADVKATGFPFAIAVAP